MIPSIPSIRGNHKHAGRMEDVLPQLSFIFIQKKKNKKHWKLTKFKVWFDRKSHEMVAWALCVKFYQFLLQKVHKLEEIRESWTTVPIFLTLVIIQCEWIMLKTNCKETQCHASLNLLKVHCVVCCLFNSRMLEFSKNGFLHILKGIKYNK